MDKNLIEPFYREGIRRTMNGLVKTQLTATRTVLSLPEIVSLILWEASAVPDVDFARGRERNYFADPSFRQQVILYFPQPLVLNALITVSRVWHDEGKRLMNLYPVIGMKGRVWEPPPSLRRLASLGEEEGSYARAFQARILDYPGPREGRKPIRHEIGHLFVQALSGLPNITTIQLKIQRIDEAEKSLWEALASLRNVRTFSYQITLTTQPDPIVFSTIASWRNLKRLGLHLPARFYMCVDTSILSTISAPPLESFETALVGLPTNWFLSGSKQTLKHLLIDNWGNPPIPEQYQTALLCQFQETLETLVLGEASRQEMDCVLSANPQLLPTFHNLKKISLKHLQGHPDLIPTLLSRCPALHEISLGFPLYPLNITPGIMQSVLAGLDHNYNISGGAFHNHPKIFHAHVKLPDWPMETELEVADACLKRGIELRLRAEFFADFAIIRERWKGFYISGIKTDLFMRSEVTGGVSVPVPF